MGTSWMVAVASLVSLSVAGCAWMSSDNCSDAEYDGCSSSGSYNGSSYDPSYGGTPDASPPAECIASFSVVLWLPANSGDCQLVLSADGYGSSYEYGYGDNDSNAAAVYFVPASPPDAGTSCEPLAGPTLAGCTRTDQYVTARSSDANEMAALTARLGVGTAGTFTAVLTCANVLAPISQPVQIACATATPATPTTGSAGDAGAGDAGMADAATTGDDAATDSDGGAASL